MLKKLTSLWLPLLLIVIYLVAIYFLKDVFPSGEEIYQNFYRFFEKYGYEIVFIGAFLEAALIISFFVPGVSAVLAGAYFASIGVISYPIFLVVAALGFFLGFLLDYLIGYFGFSDILRRFGLSSELNIVHKKVENLGGKSFFIGFIHPDTASFFAIAAGIVRMNIRVFILYSFLAGSLWLVFWTALVFFFGKQFERALDQDWLWLVVLIPLIIWMIRIFRAKD